MRTHDLKTWPSYFEAVRKREKRFEVRVNDRDFAVGDELILSEFDPAKLGGMYTGREIRTFCTYILHGGQFGVQPNTVVMSLGEIELSERKTP